MNHVTEFMNQDTFPIASHLQIQNIFFGKNNCRAIVLSGQETPASPIIENQVSLPVLLDLN